MLKFSNSNQKLAKLAKLRKMRRWLKNGRKIYSLNLPAGRSCPGAKDCKSMSIVIDGKTKVKDAPSCQFRCYAASLEGFYPYKRAMHYHNFQLLRTTKGWRAIYQLLVDSLPSDCGILRLHDSGDFFKYEYLRAVYELAKSRPDILFYGYTKSLHHLQKLGMQDPSKGLVLPNFLLTASRGGKYDHLIEVLGIREAVVVGTKKQAKMVGLVCDLNDSHAANCGGSFGLLVHGIQPKGGKYSQYIWRGKNKDLYSLK